MNVVILFIVLFIAFICGDNVLTDIGYPHQDFTTSMVFRLHPLTYLAFFLVIYFFISGKLKIADVKERMKGELVFLAVCLLTIGYLQITDNLTAVAFFLDALILPALLSMLLKVTDAEVLYRLRKWVYIYFFINAALSVIEKATNSYLVAKNADYGFSYFRSSALYGHPLNNGLTMAVLTVILYLASKSGWLKFSVIAAGMISIFCFGARGALLGVFFGIILNVILNAFTSKDKRNLKRLKNGIFYILVLIGITFIVVSYTSLGDRIAKLFYVDDSAEVRVSSFSVMDRVNVHNLLWGGNSLDQIGRIQDLAGVEIIENFYIVWILKFGLVLTVLLFVSLIRFLYSMMYSVKNDIRIAILFTFAFVASTNNSLASSTLVVSLMVLAYYILMDYNLMNYADFLVTKPDEDIDMEVIHE